MEQLEVAMQTTRVGDRALIRMLFRDATERAETAEKEAERKTLHAARRDMDLRRSHQRERRLLDCRGTNEVQALVIQGLRTERDTAQAERDAYAKRLTLYRACSCADPMVGTDFKCAVCGKPYREDVLALLAEAVKLVRSIDCDYCDGSGEDYYSADNGADGPCAHCNGTGQDSRASAFLAKLDGREGKT